MLKISFSYSLLFILSACTTQLNYLGTAYAPTEKVDVYVDQSAIDKPYRIIGKGFMKNSPHLNWTVEKMQQRAVEKAKQKGADAVLIYDYYILNPGTSINTVFHTDSIGMGVVSVGGSSVIQNSYSGFNIIFLKYEK